MAGPADWPADPPLRARTARRPGAPGRQEAGPDPARRRPSSPGPGSPGGSTSRRPGKRSATATCTPRSMTTPGWPTSRSWTTSEPGPRPVLAPRPPLVHRARHHVQRVLTDNGVGYRSRLFRAGARRRRRAPPPHPAVPAADQREGGAVQPHPAGRVGLRRLLPLERRRDRGLASHGSTGTTITEPTPPSAAEPPISRIDNLTGYCT